MSKDTLFTSPLQTSIVTADENGDVRLPRELLAGVDQFDLTRRRSEPAKDPPWMKVGTGAKNRRGTSMSINRVFKALSSNAATALLSDSIDARDPATNIVVIETESMSPAELAKYRRGVKTLLELGVMKRVKNRHYMINPSLVLPWENGEALRAKWESL